jgi:hypothetical protein
MKLTIKRQHIFDIAKHSIGVFIGGTGAIFFSLAVLWLYLFARDFLSQG